MPSVVLFGAGASFGAGEIRPAPPPLGNQLFPILAREFPRTWGSLNGPASTLFMQDFEAGMGWLWQNNSTAAAPLQKDLGAFFARFELIPNGRNSYSALIAALVRRQRISDICFSTLNYELLLEFALSAQGLAVNYFDDSRKDSVACVMKPHGSCNFLPQGIRATGGITFTSGIAFQSAIEAVQVAVTRQFCADPNNALYPAMVAFMQGKPTQICPDGLKSIQRIWSARVADASKVAIVGVRPHAVDAHIWGELARTEAELLFVGDQHGFEEWASTARPTKRNRFVGSTFDAAVGVLGSDL